MPTGKSLKIVVVGPSACGKSSIVDALTNGKDSTRAPYMPTKSLRILETDVKGMHENGAPSSRNIAAQLWEAGGERQNQRFWSSLLYNADGILIVYNAERAGQEKDLETAAYYFNQRPESAILKPFLFNQIFVVANHHRPLAHVKHSDSTRLPAFWIGKTKEIHINVAEDATVLRKEFADFINRIASDKK